ncbi:MAG: beta-Ala-His dipeptidase [Deltaproteobacteria bacterium]|nr:beta-Ala-His dipeptidase [Deltaproteobacteria bacterium]
MRYIFMLLVLVLSFISGFYCLASAEPSKNYIAVNEGADTKRILAIFEEISQVPRCSKEEGPISAWLVRWAQERNLAVKTDKFNNVIISVPASRGYEDRPVVALQAHMDMVCQKSAQSTHNFSSHPIQLVRDGELLRAKSTTLGADDGIGVAIALFLAENPDVERPALELLFTTDEEMDMSGAAGLASDILLAERFINIDSEAEGFVTLGSAGGVKIEILLPLNFVPLTTGIEAYTLSISGLKGGHSGLEIDKNRPNANVLLAQALHKAPPLQIISFAGGSADNAITMDSVAVFALPAGSAPALQEKIALFEQELRQEYSDETNLEVALNPVAELPKKALSLNDSDNLLGLILAIPQGVYEWSKTFPGLPETSNNIGISETRDGELRLVVFHRSFNPQRLAELAQKIEATAKMSGATSKRRSEFPTWPPNPNSVLYKKALAAYERAFNSTLRTEVLHAGLECGFIAEKYPHMEIISIGPTMRYVHTPSEHLFVPSVERILLFLRGLLKDL